MRLRTNAAAVSTREAGRSSKTGSFETVRTVYQYGLATLYRIVSGEARRWSAPSRTEGATMTTENRASTSLRATAYRIAAWPYRVAAARAAVRALSRMDRRELADIGRTISDVRD